MPNAKFVAAGAAVIVVAIVAVSFLGIGPKKVTLTYSEGACVTTDPPVPEIYKNKWKYKIIKPKKVRWEPVDHQKGMYIWKIAYDPASAGGKPVTGDHLTPDEGIKDISCTGPQHTLSKKAPNDGSADGLYWPYGVGVYNCDGELICPVDPIIYIKN